MRDDNKGFTAFIRQLKEEVKDLATVAGIQITCGLIRKDEIGIVRKSAGNGNTLLLTAGKLIGEVVQTVAEAHTSQERFHLLRSLAPGNSRCEGGILQRSQLRHEHVILEDKAHGLVTEKSAL